MAWLRGLCFQLFSLILASLAQSPQMDSSMYAYVKSLADQDELHGAMYSLLSWQVCLPTEFQRPMGCPEVAFGQAFGWRPPIFCPQGHSHWSLARLRLALPAFARVYDQRPIRINTFGVGANHAFSLWYTVRTLKPLTYHRERSLVRTNHLAIKASSWARGTHLFFGPTGWC